jgi:2-hydroxychromene-2-carboxylate isomerase
MSPSRQVDFFFFFGSAYAYLSVMRIEALAAEAGVTVKWRPFSVRALMTEQGNNLRNLSAKVAYMWRDVERRSAVDGVAFTRPPPWPTDPDQLANKVGIVAMLEGWCPAYTKASFSSWYLDGRHLGDRDVITGIIAELGQDPGRILAAAQSEEVCRRYDQETDAARRAGAFGSPSFVVDGELFWGDDRLEEALDWATGRHPRQLMHSASVDEHDRDLHEQLVAFGEAWARGDTDVLDRLLSPTYTHTDAAGRLLQRNEWLDYATSRTGRGTQIAFRDLQVRRVSENVAVVTGANDLSGPGTRSSTDDAPLAIRFTQVWTRRDGRWLRESFQATPTGPTDFS